MNKSSPTAASKASEPLGGRYVRRPDGRLERVGPAMKGCMVPALEDREAQAYLDALPRPEPIAREILEAKAAMNAALVKLKVVQALLEGRNDPEAETLALQTQDTFGPCGLRATLEMVR